jgi:hypothetical protein
LYRYSGLTHVNAEIIFFGCALSYGTQEDLMQIRNATCDRRLDLLDCRMTVLGLDLYAIKNGEIFDDLKRHCMDCIFPESCAADLRRDPNNPVWETYCPNAPMLGGELVETEWFKQR